MHGYYETPETETANEALVPDITKLTYQDQANLRRLYVTIRHPEVKACGHKLDIENDPKNNCLDCWFAYFQNNGGMTAVAVEIVEKHGEQALISMRGKKFVKMFIRFISYVDQLKKELEKNGKSGTGSPNGEVRDVQVAPEGGGGVEQETRGAALSS